MALTVISFHLIKYSWSRCDHIKRLPLQFFIVFARGYESNELQFKNKLERQREMLSLAHKILF